MQQIVWSYLKLSITQSKVYKSYHYHRLNRLYYRIKHSFKDLFITIIFCTHTLLAFYSLHYKTSQLEKWTSCIPIYFHHGVQNDKNGHALIACLESSYICVKDTECHIHKLVSSLFKYGIIHENPQISSEQNKKHIISLLCGILTPSGYVWLYLISNCVYMCVYVCKYVYVCKHTHISLIILYTFVCIQLQAWNTRKYSSTRYFIYLLV